MTRTYMLKEGPVMITILRIGRKQVAIRTKNLKWFKSGVKVK